MDGISKAKLQESIGVREIVEDIDALRLLLGFDNVIVLTPKVEVRLRSGSLAQIPLKVICHIGNYYHLEFSFPTGYPMMPLACSISLKSSDSNDSNIDAMLTCTIDDYCRTKVQIDGLELNYPRADNVVIHTRSVIEKSLVSITSGIEINADSNEVMNMENVNVNDIISATKSDERFDDATDSSYFTCKKCGTFLFHNTDIEIHTPPLNDSNRSQGNSNICSSIFLSSSPSFIDQVNLSQQDSYSIPGGNKILCPKCNSKLGQWSWSGNQCSCGTWVVPSFQFTASKLDNKINNNLRNIVYDSTVQERAADDFNYINLGIS